MKDIHENSRLPPAEPSQPSYQKSDGGVDAIPTEGLENLADQTPVLPGDKERFHINTTDLEVPVFA